MEQNLCQVYKSAVSLAKMKELLNPNEVDQSVSFRCQECEKCSVCRTSPINKAVSLKERVEQSYIEDSIEIDIRINRF